jgi:hypothetical protein
MYPTDAVTDALSLTGGGGGGGGDGGSGGTSAKGPIPSASF